MNNDLSIDDELRRWYCNRGIMVRRSIDNNNNNNTQIVCLCPPAYYGHLCQYQNQRVSLTMQVRASFEFRTLFAIVITLRDDEQNGIESYDQINYLYERDCRKKFNIYLLYSTRPKNTSTNYSVHIDMFNKETLEYRASWLFPIKFPFLPVYRLAIQLQISSTKIIPQNCQSVECGIHGHCSQYVNTKFVLCLCNEGWSGKHCDIQHTCHCSSDSLCYDSNICVCPLEKFAPRCSLKHLACTCGNGGTCAPNDERLGQVKERCCLCPERFSGLTCEIPDTELMVSFAREIPIPKAIHIHFIQVFGKNKSHLRSTTFKKIAIDKETVSVFRFIPFHIIFIEIKPKTYYLSVLQQEFVPSTNILSTLKFSDRCLAINELFNETIVKMHLLRRMKYYHIPCQQQTNLACFYDETNMCICNKDLRQANCLTFNHSMIYDCEEQNPCENQGQCFRDDPNCPTAFMCVCDECSYGSRCRISTKGFGLSLDIILGYHIKPNVPFAQQRLVIKVTTAIVTLMLIGGLVNSILSVLTFHNKKTCEVGCGYYLFVSSYTSAIIMIMFALKFCFLLVSQMGMITSRNYLTFNCIFIEFLLKILLSTSDWLHAFVGIERAITAVSETKFDKTKAKRMAKWIIIGSFILTITTHIHDPLYRRMIDDTEEEHRIWCHVQFSSSLQLFNSIILAFHFIVPFISNIISALTIIIHTARQRSTAQRQQPQNGQLRKQLYKLKHLLISPIVLIILGLPRLVISFLSGCMKTTRGNPWPYLIGYLISFLPPMLIFIVFILPSKMYKDEFNKTVKRIQRRIHYQ